MGGNVLAGRQPDRAREARNEVGLQPRSEWLPGRFDLVIYEVATGATRVVAQHLYSATLPSLVLNDAGTRLLFRWPDWLGV